VHDARIVAICVSHGVRELLTMDRDFNRFGGAQHEKSAEL
jgi:predicted nucleic acid-binding protein